MSDFKYQNTMGQVYGGTREVSMGGSIPVWLEQKGSRTLGGVIKLDHAYDSGVTVAMVYPTGIRTGSPCAEGAGKTYIPIPTFKVLSEVSAEATSVVVACRKGFANLVAGLSIHPAGNSSKSVTIAANKLATNSDGNFVLTITANAFGVLAAGDVLIAKEAASLEPVGLTKNDIDGYDGMVSASTVLAVTLVDEGRIIAERCAPIVPSWKKDYLQTIKFE